MSDVVEGAFRRHWSDVYRFVRRRGAAHERAEELTQDVFADAAAALARAPATSPTLAWLYTVARRRFIDDLRRNGRARGGSLAAEDGTLEYGPALVQAVREALGRLPEEQRRVVVLKLLRGARFAEIAGELGTTETAARMRFSRGLAALRDDLRRKGMEP